MEWSGRGLPSGGRRRECPEPVVRRNPAGSVSAEPGIMLIPWTSRGGNWRRHDGPRKSLSSHWGTQRGYWSLMGNGLRLYGALSDQWLLESVRVRRLAQGHLTARRSRGSN